MAAQIHGSKRSFAENVLSFLPVAGHSLGGGPSMIVGKPFRYKKKEKEKSMKNRASSCKHPFFLHSPTD
jgi:hypothetical protein